MLSKRHKIVVLAQTAPGFTIGPVLAGILGMIIVVIGLFYFFVLRGRGGVLSLITGLFGGLGGGTAGVALTAARLNISLSALLAATFFGITALSPGLTDIPLGPYGALYIIEILSVLGVLGITLAVMHRGGWSGARIGIYLLPLFTAVTLGAVLFGASLFGSPLVTGTYTGGEGVAGAYLVVLANDVVDDIRENILGATV
jgi:hypothetical protein